MIQINNTKNRNILTISVLQTLFKTFQALPSLILTTLKVDIIINPHVTDDDTEDRDQRGELTCPSYVPTSGGAVTRSQVFMTL